MSRWAGFIFLYYAHRVKEESDAFVAAREKVKARLDRLVVYQKYLEKVIESAEEFHEIREILSRHDTLTSTHQVSSPKVSKAKLCQIRV